MRVLFIMVFFSLFAINATALDLKGQIEALKAKSAAGKDIQEDLKALTAEAEKNSQSLVITKKIDFSLIDNDGKVSLFVAGKSSNTIIPKSTKHEVIAVEALKKHPQAKITQNDTVLFDSGASSSSSNGGFGHLLQSIFGGILSIGGDVVSGALGGAIEAVV